VIHPDAHRFVLGADWWLYAFDAEGKQLWKRPAPGPVWAVNISGDGRLVVAAYGDGIIRWHRMDDGRELLALQVLSDKKNWVAWTPEGFYDATPGALLPYGVDAGTSADLKASAISADEFRHEVAELAKYGRVLVLLTPVIRAPPPATARH
jgi:hypothetical protein